MTTLVIGATGATGKHLVQQLLNLQQEVKIIVRSTDKLPESWKTNSRLSIIEASISEITEEEMVRYVQNCDAAASCLGHNLTFKGIYGKPRKLVTDAIRLICEAVKTNATGHPVKIVLMNTSGNRNRDLNKPISWGQKFIIALIRLLVPPHVDNEKAADYLRTQIGQNNPSVEWVAVRPDTLINEDEVSEYEVYPSPTRSAIFNAGKVSRINVADFMARLITEKDLWHEWKGQMPVIYKTA